MSYPDLYSAKPCPDEKNKSRPRVVFIQPSLGVQDCGGSLVVTLELCRRLSYYFEVELLCGKDCGDWSHVISCIPRSSAQKFLEYPFLKFILGKVSTHPDIVVEHLSSFFPCLIRLLRRPPDLVFPHNDYGGLMVAACARYFNKVPVLFSEHNGLLADGNCLRRNLKFKPDHLVVFDEETASYARSVRPSQSLSVIPNGVDLERFSPEGPYVDFSLRHPLVLCVGSLDRSNHKRIDLAIKAVAKLPEVSLLVCGDGPDKSYIQSLGDKVLGSDRFLVRSVPFECMPQVYRGADLFTLPSEREPFGLVYVEAMASGLPVVAPDETSQQNIVRDGGVLCDVTDIDEYTASIKLALSTDWGNKPRQNAERFCWNEVTVQYRDLILGMISRKKQPAH